MKARIILALSIVALFSGFAGVAGFPPGTVFYSADCLRIVPCPGSGPDVITGLNCTVNDPSRWQCKLLTPPVHWYCEDYKGACYGTLAPAPNTCYVTWQCK